MNAYLRNALNLVIQTLPKDPDELTREQLVYVIQVARGILVALVAHDAPEPSTPDPPLSSP